MISFQTIYNNDKKNFSLPQSLQTYQLLLNKISENYQIQPFSIQMQYLDHSQQYLPISSLNDLESAFKNSSEIDPFKLYLSSQDNGNSRPYNQDRIKDRIQDRKENRLFFKYSKGKLYESFDIFDESEIELYRSKLIELHHLGYRRSRFNLKILVSLRSGEDFSLAFEEIKKVEDERKRKLENRRQERRKRTRNEVENTDMNEDRKQKKRKRNNHSHSSSVSNEIDSNEVDNMVIDSTRSFIVLNEWPENTYHQLFIDGNNLMYLTQTLRRNTLHRKMKKTMDIIVGSVKFFSIIVPGLEEVVVIFDNCKTPSEMVLENGTRFKVVSARPQAKTSDDALVNITTDQDDSTRRSSLHVTSDRELSNRLSFLNAVVVKPKNFFSVVIRRIKGGQGEVDIDKWFSEIEENLNQMV